MNSDQKSKDRSISRDFAQDSWLAVSALPSQIMDQIQEEWRQEPNLKETNMF